MQKSKQRRPNGSEWQRETIFLLMTVQKDPVYFSWDVNCNITISVFLWMVKTGWLVSESYIIYPEYDIWFTDPVLKWRPCWASRRTMRNHCRRCLQRAAASHRFKQWIIWCVLPMALLTFSQIDSIPLDSCPRCLSANLVDPSAGASMPCSSGIWTSLFVVHISTHYWKAHWGFCKCEYSFNN